MTTATQTPYAAVGSALPFWLSLGMMPVALIGVGVGGWATALLPLYSWGLFSLLDAIGGLNTANANPETDEDDIFLHTLLTQI